MPKTIIFNGRLITVTMEVPGLSSLDYKRKYADHLESLWQSSTIHASKELMERFKDGEELPEGSYDVWTSTTPTSGCNNKIAIIVAFPAVEEGSQDEMWAKIIFDARWYDGTPQGLVKMTEHFKSQYKLTKI